MSSGSGARPRRGVVACGGIEPVGARGWPTERFADVGLVLTAVRIRMTVPGFQATPFPASAIH